MTDFFAGWSSAAIIGLVSVVGGLATVVAIVWAVSWAAVRRAEIATDLKRDLVARGLPVDQIERIVQGPSPAAAAVGKELEAQLASILVQQEVPAHVMDEVLHVFQQTDATTKQAVYNSLVEIVEAEASDEHLLAAVRGLCAPPPARQPDSAIT
jgi:hypothetical protein